MTTGSEWAGGGLGENWDRDGRGREESRITGGWAASWSDGPREEREGIGARVGSRLAGEGIPDGADKG